MLSLVDLTGVMVAGSRMLTFLESPSGLLGRAGLEDLGAGTGKDLSWFALSSFFSIGKAVSVSISRARSG